MSMSQRVSDSPSEPSRCQEVAEHLVSAHSAGRVPLAVMLSGTGRSLLNLIEVIDRGELDVQIQLVIASKPCRGEEIARARRIETLIERGELGADRFESLLRAAGVTPERGLVVLAGYLRRVPIPRGYEGRIVNIHPALLPDFGGRGMHGRHVHEAVLEAGRAESGCTVHLCDGEYDRGAILLQLRCEVMKDDTPETLAARVFELEKRAYPEALRGLVARDRG